MDFSLTLLLNKLCHSEIWCRCSELIESELHLAANVVRTSSSVKENTEDQALSSLSFKLEAAAKEGVNAKNI